MLYLQENVSTLEIDEFCFDSLNLYEDKDQDYLSGKGQIFLNIVYYLEEHLPISLTEYYVKSMMF